MCWPTPLHPASPFRTPWHVLLPLLEFAAIGSAVDVCPGSQNHRSRLFLLIFAFNLSVCYPWALTPTISLPYKYFDCPASIFFRKALLSGGSLLFINNYPKESGFWSLLEECNYRSRRTQLQQLPHLEVIRINETLLVLICLCQMDFSDRSLWGFRVQDFVTLLVSGYDSQPRPISCVVYPANSWICTRYCNDV